MSRQPLCSARKLSSLNPNLNHHQNVVLSDRTQYYDAPPRLYFARTALFTALTTSVIGFGAAPVMAAESNSAANHAVNSAMNNNSINDSTSNNQTERNVASDNSLQQQAMRIQQQGYQMMTPAQIERELAAINTVNSQANRNDNKGFDTPVATLDKRSTPIGFDVDLDATTLPIPTNLETLGSNVNAESRAEKAETMARPINVSDAVNSRGISVDAATNPQLSSPETVAPQNTKPLIKSDSAKANSIEDKINPEDYLPDYEGTTESQAIVESIEQGAKPKPQARNQGGFIKGLYNRFFNGGYIALPHVKTTVYLQQDADKNAVDSTPKLIKADDKGSLAKLVNNIKAALDDTTVQSVADFTAALPRLRQTAFDAAKAVGYYDITLSLRQPSSDKIDVIIQKLGNPVCIDEKVIDIRGEGGEQAEFIALEKTLEKRGEIVVCRPDEKNKENREGEIFDHGVYKDSKAAIESLSNTYGYFDPYWLNKSVDIILPDNTADVSLIYDTGERYKYDDVVFFTYDDASGTLTQDPDKLPVELPLLRQLYKFRAGDPFYRPDITKFSNDLSATRYFNTVNVETIVPPDMLSDTSTLSFDNISMDDVGVSSSDDALNTANVGKTTSPERISTTNASTKKTVTDSDDNTSSHSGSTLNDSDIAPIDFEVDEETYEKLAAIKQKAERLSSLPNDRVLDEKKRETDSILGKISDSISSVAKKLFPDEEKLIDDEDFVSPTLAGRKTPQQVQDSKKVPLYVFVYADKPRDAQFGIGYGTDTGVRATGKIDYNLINRKGYQAGAEVAVSRINKNATVYGSRPWKHPLDDKLESRLSYEEETIDQGEGNFDLSTKTLKAILARNIHRENRWDRSYFVRYRLDQLETGVDDAELEDLPVRFVSSNPKQQALLFGYGINKTTVDDVANPTRGYRQYYAIEAGADKAFSDTDLVIFRAGASGLYSFGEDNKHQVLGSLSGGYIWAEDFYDVPYKLRFFAGGDQSIRGYDYNSLSPIDKGYLTGGQILAVGSAEYNYEFKPGFRGAVFSDVGNAYDKNFNADTKVGVGVGIRWASPVGVVRVDVAAGVTEDDIPIRLHFFIGSPL